LGSPTNYFRNIYVQGTHQLNTVQQSSDAGLLELHANLTPGDTKDVGIFGKFSTGPSSNSFAFFGLQDATSNFVYKITTTDATAGNSVVYDGVYGNVQVGSLFLSNSTVSSSTSTGTMIVAGGAGIGGNLNVGGNISVGGYQVLTSNTPGLSAYTQVTAFNSPITTTAINPATSTSTGALVLSFGGAGIAGNVYAGGNVVAQTGLVGNYYGTIQTASQPNITTVGTLGNLTITNSLNVNSINATSMGITNITATGNVNVSTINGLIGLQVTGNTTSTGFVGNFYGTLQTASQPNITSTGALTVPSLTATTTVAVTGNVTAGNVSATKGTFTNIQGTLLTAAQTNVTSVGTLSGLSVSGNTAITSTVYAQGIYDNGNRTLSTTSGAGNLTISGTQVTLTPTGPGVSYVGSATSIPVIGVDQFGRVANISSVTVTETLSTAGSSGTGSINLLTQSLTIAGGTDTSTTASSQTVTINSTSTLATVTGRGATTSATLTLNGQVNMGASIVPTANVTYNLGSTTGWWNNIYGTAIHAQYADLAENYSADSDYEPGTVVVFGGDSEITTTNTFADVSVAGAISTNPAYLMNGAAGGLPLALRGRIPVNVIGPVSKGDLLVTAGANPGYAVSVGKDKSYGVSIFAKALETNLEDGKKTIEAVIL
jgi:hypothetical protein